MKLLRTIVVLVLIFLMIGCSDEPHESRSQNDGNISILKTGTNFGQETSGKVEELLINEHNLKNVIVVNDDRLMVVAIEPRHMDRLKLKDLRKTLKNTVESSFSSYEVELSTDKKIFLELEKLKEQILNQSILNDDLSKELERIRKLSKEQT